MIHSRLHSSQYSVFPFFDSSLFAVQSPLVLFTMMITAAAADVVRKKDDQLSKYLEMREAIKEKIRLRKNKSDVVDGELTFGSFFGPSAPVIQKKRPVFVEKKSKNEFLKESRDYSFITPYFVVTKRKTPENADSDEEKSKAKSSASTNPVPWKIDPIPKPNFPNPKPLETPKSVGNQKSTKVTVRVISRPPQEIAKINKKTTEEKAKSPATANPIPRKVDSIPKPKIRSPKSQETLKSGGNQKSTKTAATSIRRPPQEIAKVCKKSDSTKRRRVCYDEEEEGEDEKALSIVRKMFNTKRFAGRDDRDVGAMESTFEEIGKEERKSAKVARKEDAEELRRLVLEEQREKERKRRLVLGKKRKLGD